MVLKRALVAVMVCLLFAPFLEGTSSTKGPQSFRLYNERVLQAERSPLISATQRYDILATLSADASSDADTLFGQEQASFIRQWFYEQAKLGTLPSDMTRHDPPPPLRRDGILPAELRQRVQPLPVALECQLPTLTGNLRRVIVLGDVVLLEEGTSRIVDLIPSVL
jgi:hypothetical protein